MFSAACSSALPRARGLRPGELWWTLTYLPRWPSLRLTSAVTALSALRASRERTPGFDLRSWTSRLSTHAGYSISGPLSLTDEPIWTATQKAVDYARSREKLITFDPNLRSPQEGAHRLLNDYGVSLAMIMLGPRGCYLKNAGGDCFVPAPSATPVDTTGAGDIFGGSAVSRLLELGRAPAELDRDDLAYIARFAAAAASLSTERPGGIPSVPDRAEVLARL